MQWGQSWDEHVDVIGNALVKRAPKSGRDPAEQIITARAQQAVVVACTGGRTGDHTLLTFCCCFPRRYHKLSFAAAEPKKLQPQ